MHFGSSDRDVSGLRNARQKRSGPVEDFANAREGRDEDRRDLGASEIASREDEHSGVAGTERRDLQRTISQSLVLGQDDPAPLAGRLEPDTIVFIASEMVVMNLDPETALDKFCS